MNVSVSVLRRTAPAALLALALTTAGWQSPAIAAPGTPINLAPSGAVATNTPVLSWTKSAGAVKYEVQVDNNADFSSPLFTSTTTNNRSVPDKVLPSGDVSWRVRALDASNVSSGWAVETITVAQTSIPTPVSPVGGDPLQQPNQPPLLTWTAVQGATSYTVQVDETDLFTSPMVDMTTQTTSTVVPNPLPAGEYFWRVKAAKAVGVDSLFSDPVSFVIVPQAAPVTLGSGLPTENAVEDVELSWNPVAGASFYQLQVALDIDFNNIVDDKSGLSSKVFGTHYSPAVTYDNNQYFWRVRAVDAGGNRLAWSAVRQFTRSWPDTPQPVRPLGSVGSPGHVTSQPYFQWTPVQHATQYELQLGTDANFSPSTYELCETAGTTFTTAAFEINHNTGVTTAIGCDVTPGVVYYWRVRPLDQPFPNPGVEGLYSPTQSFVYDDSDVFASFDPTNGETVDVPTLSWVPVRKAAKYVISIKDNLNATVVSNKTTYSTSYTPFGVPKLDPAKGPFSWSVYAVGFDGTPMSRVYTNTFNVSGNLPTYGTAALTLQPTAAGSLPPNLRWEPYPGADHYRLFAGIHGSGTFWTDGATANDAIGVNLPYSAVTDTWTWFLDPGQYDWYVQAFNASNAVLGTSSVGTFTINQLAAVGGQSIAIDGTTLDAHNGCEQSVNDVPDICDNVPATPVLSWNPVPGAELYIIYLSEDSSFTNLVEPVTALGATNGTRWAPTMKAAHPALPDSNANTAYYWFVRPCKSTTQCGPSPVSTTGMATNKFRKSSPAVVLTAPTAGATITTSDVHFDWADYFDTNQATTWSLTGEESPQAAQSYRIQVDDDPAFGSPIETVVVDQSVYTAPTRLYPEGELYWRVQAVDADDNGLTWSTPARLFIKATTKPSLTSPLNQTVGGTTAFRWGAMTSLGSYQLEVYKNNDTAATPANRLFGSTITTTQSAYVFTKPIPASAEAYVWRVRRVDAYNSNNKGPWSDWGTFHSTGAAPTLIAPAAGAYQPANGPLFTWADVPGATTYTLEVRSVATGGALSGTPKTTPATAWAATATVKDGVWEWRVTAKDSNGGALGTSPWRQFKVDGTRPTVVSKAPTGLSVSRTANFKATFSERVTNVSHLTMKLYVAGTATLIQATVTLSADGKVATLNPEVNLAAGRKYTVKLTTGIKDLAGNTLVATSWTVKTA